MREDRRRKKACAKRIIAFPYGTRSQSIRQKPRYTRPPRTLPIGIHWPQAVIFTPEGSSEEASWHRRTFGTGDGADPSIAAIAHAMKAGRNFVTSGPLLLLQMGGRPVGDVIHVSQPSDFQVSVQAWPSGAVGEHFTKVELIRNGEIVKVFAVSHGKREFTSEFSIHENGPAWYIARCFGSDDLQVAITNPIYFESSDYRPLQPTISPCYGNRQ